MPRPGPLPPPGLPEPCLLCPNRLRICAILLRICPNWGCEPCALFPRCCLKPNPRIGPRGPALPATLALHLGQPALAIFAAATFGPPGPLMNPMPFPGPRLPIGPPAPRIMPCGPERPGVICGCGPRPDLAGAVFWASNASPPSKRTAITAHKAIFLTILHPFQAKTFFPFSYPVLQTTRRVRQTLYCRHDRNYPDHPQETCLLSIIIFSAVLASHSIEPFGKAALVLEGLGLGGQLAIQQVAGKIQ